MVSLVIDSLSQWRRKRDTAECGGKLPQGRQDIRPGPTRTSRMRAGPTLKSSEDAPASEWSRRQEPAQTEDGAGGGPAEVRTCARRRGLCLLKIGAPRTRMQGRRDILFTTPNVDGGNSNYSARLV